MKTLVLIDDEYFFRKSLRAFIEKLKNYKVIGEANNGESGRKLIETLKPDIALVDISMPVINGLEMITALYPRTDTCFVLLTGYGEFEYAKQAISLGVRDYLLKPLDYEELLNTLDKLSREIDLRRKEQTASSNYYQYRDLYESQMNTNIFHKICSSALSTEDFSAFLHESPLKNDTDFIVFIIKLNRKQSSVWNLESDCALCHSILKNICLEILAQQEIPALYIDDTLVLQYVICGFNKENVSYTSKLPEICKRLMKIFCDTAHLPACIFLGTCHPGQTGIKSSYEEALSLLHNYSRKNLTLFKAYDPVSASEQLFQNESISQLCQELLILLRQNQVQQIQEFITQRFDRMQKEVSHIKKIKISALLFITTLHDFLSERGTSSNNISELQHTLDQIDVCDSTEMLKTLILSTYDKALTSFAQTTPTSKSKLVQAAQTYISQHYMDPDLHLETIASVLFVSSQYLCTVFSQEVHLTLGAYINSFRMQKAKDLLLTSSPSIQNTALLCGFTDPGYFSKCFKRYYGISPRKFLDMYDNTNA